MAERRSVTGAEGLAVEASRKSTRGKSHPLTVEEKAEKTRADGKRWNVGGVESLAAYAIRKSARRMTNSITGEQKAEKAMANATRYRKTRLTVDKKKC